MKEQGACWNVDQGLHLLRSERNSEAYSEGGDSTEAYEEACKEFNR